MKAPGVVVSVLMIGLIISVAGLVLYIWYMAFAGLF